jgi:hypothetical protein
MRTLPAENKWGIYSLIGLLLASIGFAQTGTLEQQAKVVEALAGFYNQYGTQEERDWVRKAFLEKRLYFKPSADPAGVDKQDRIYLNSTTVDQFQDRDQVKRWRAVADLAATVRHERAHLAQSHFGQGLSEIISWVGAGYPTEVEAWRVGFQAYREWIVKQSDRVTQAKSERDREEEAKRLRELLRGFEKYRSEYQALNHGAMVFPDGMTLAQASEEVQKMLRSVDKLLERVDFKVSVSPYKTTVMNGQSFTVVARAIGGEFYDPAPNVDNSSHYTFFWYAGGKPLPERGPVLKRIATVSESVTVVAMDRLGRKTTEATCRVEVVPPARSTAPPTPSPSKTAGSIQPLRKPAPSIPLGGTWVLKATRPLGQAGADSACYPKHSLSLGPGTATGTCHYVNCGNNPAWGKAGSGSATGRITWNTLPATLRPGERVTLNITLALEHGFVPLGLPCGVYVYFNSQSAVGGGSIGHGGDNPTAKDNAPVKVELPPMPGGRPGQTFTIWINVATPGGIGDCFYDYEFR